MCGCWLWMGNRTIHGYGKIKAEGKNKSAHRVSYEVFKGPINDGLWVLHKCDVRACVNPDHLYLGTHADNTADMVKRNRSVKWGGRRKGLNNPNCRLSEDEIKEVVILLKSGVTHQRVADRFGVGRSTITHLWLGRTWEGLIQ